MEEQEIIILQSSIDSLRSHRYWRQKNDSQSLFLLKFTLVCILLLPVPLVTMFHLYWVIRENRTNAISEGISTVTSLWFCIFIAFNFIFHRRYLHALLKDLSDLKRFGKPPNFDDTNRRYNLYAKLNGYYCGFGVLFYAFLTTFQYNCEENGKICALFLPVVAPFRIDRFPMIHLIYAYQIIAGWVILKGAAHISFMVFEIAGHFILRMKHLKGLLVEIFDEPSRIRRREKLRRCIEYHQHLIELADRFDFCFYNCNGAYIIGIGLMFGCMANQIVVQSPLKPVTHFIGWFISLYVRCYAGQVIYSESLTIATAAFKSKWYHVDSDLLRDLNFLILRSQKPIILHAGPIGITSFALLVKLLRTSYSYFTLMNQTTG